MPNEVLDLQRTTVVPATAPSSKKRLYVTKDGLDALNIALDDETGTRAGYLLRSVQLSGPTTLYQSTAGVAIQGTYKIENYDSFTTYTVSISAGSVSMSGDTLTVTSPTTAGPIYLKVNGESSKILIRPPAVKTPSITYPIAGLLLAPTFSATPEAIGIRSGRMWLS